MMVYSHHLQSVWNDFSFGGQTEHLVSIQTIGIFAAVYECANTVEGIDLFTYVTILKEDRNLSHRGKELT